MRAGDEVQLVGCPPTMHEVLGSTLSTAQTVCGGRREPEASLNHQKPLSFKESLAPPLLQASLWDHAGQSAGAFPHTSLLDFMLW